jgi:Raf kinase inhibitor-like YbhB/YbcL family protein
MNSLGFLSRPIFYEALGYESPSRVERKMRLISEDLQDGKPIPRKFTCDGENVSPRFRWEEAPQEAKSFVLLLDDPDAPREDGFTHWVLYNIPATLDEIHENVPKGQGRVKGLGVQGKNDAGQLGYTGPCPPSGSHRYFARLYALRKELDLKPGATARAVQDAIEGLIIEQAETMGTYVRVQAKTAGSG